MNDIVPKNSMIEQDESEWYKHENKSTGSLWDFIRWGYIYIILILISILLSIKFFLGFTISATSLFISFVVGLIFGLYLRSF